MRRKILLLLLGLALGLVAGRFFLGHRSTRTPRPTADLVPLAPAPAIAPIPPPAPIPVRDIAIQDGKTIDFSSGRPQIQDTPADRAALERAKREMDEAARNVTFPPTAPTPAAAQK